MKFGDICASSRQTQFQSLIGWENALQDFLFNLPGQTVSPGFPAISVNLEYVVRCMIASSFPLCFSAKEPTVQKNPRYLGEDLCYIGI